MLGLAQCPLLKARTGPGPFPACRRGRGSLVLDTQGDAGVTQAQVAGVQTAVEEVQVGAHVLTEASS